MGVTSNRVPSSEKKICRTPCFRQLFVQAFISLSSITFLPCCILTQSREHCVSSTEWHMHKQQSPPGPSSAGRETPVSGNAASNTASMANLGLFFIEGIDRYISQIRELIRCILLPFQPFRQITLVIRSTFSLKLRPDVRKNLNALNRRLTCHGPRCLFVNSRSLQRAPTFGRRTHFLKKLARARLRCALGSPRCRDPQVSFLQQETHRALEIPVEYRNFPNTKTLQPEGPGKFDTIPPHAQKALRTSPRPQNQTSSL